MTSLYIRIGGIVPLGPNTRQCIQWYIYMPIAIEINVYHTHGMP